MQTEGRAKEKPKDFVKPNLLKETCMQALYKRALSEAPGFQESEKSEESVINKDTEPFLITDSSDFSDS